ncbi:MAG: hypothetical protein R3F35_24010 [Myxococcota bacterium]
MVNLLGRRRDAPVVADLAPTLRADLRRRLRVVAALARSGRPDPIARSAADLAGELEELEASPSRIAAESLLEAIDRIRSETLARRAVEPTPPSAEPTGMGDGEVERASRPETDDEGGTGLFVCHRPGRSLATGEAEVASRGWFDVLDRPPLEGWVGVLPGADATGQEADFWIVAWVRPRDAVRARAGCRACPNGAVSLLETLSPAIEAELVAAMRGACGA